jgi:hypothetical protein
VLDRHLGETTAEELGTSPGLIEKDWHVVRGALWLRAPAKSLTARTA